MHDSEYSEWLDRTGTEVLIQRLDDPLSTRGTRDCAYYFLDLKRGSRGVQVLYNSNASIAFCLTDLDSKYRLR